MDEVGAALIAIALVLTAVFVPSAFITGISGQFYRQFALTIAGATVISLIVSLTLSPALCALLLKPPHETKEHYWWSAPIHGFFGVFNRYFDKLTRGYGWLSAKLVRFAVLMLVVYAGVIVFGLNEFRKTPVGFIRSSIAAISSSSRNCRRRRRWRAPTRSTGARSILRLKVPGVAWRGEHCRLLRRDLHQRAERGRDLSDPRSVRESGPRIPSNRRPRSRASCSDGWRRSRRRWSSSPRRRRCRASAMPAASA